MRRMRRRRSLQRCGPARTTVEAPCCSTRCACVPALCAHGAQATKKEKKGKKGKRGNGTGKKDKKIVKTPKNELFPSIRAKMAAAVEEAGSSSNTPMHVAQEEEAQKDGEEDGEEEKDEEEIQALACAVPKDGVPAEVEDEEKKEVKPPVSES